MLKLLGSHSVSQSASDSMYVRTPVKNWAPLDTEYSSECNVVLAVDPQPVTQRELELQEGRVEPFSLTT